LDVDFKPVTSGCIQGEQQADGTWAIQGKLSVPYTFDDNSISFYATFIK